MNLEETLRLGAFVIAWAAFMYLLWRLLQNLKS